MKGRMPINLDMRPTGLPGILGGGGVLLIVLDALGIVKGYSSTGFLLIVAGIAVSLMWAKRFS